MRRIFFNFAQNHHTMDSVLNHITIRELLKNKFRYATAFSDKLIITDHLGYLELFKYPCRIDAVSIFICTSGRMDCCINLKNYTVLPNTVVICRNSDIIQIISSHNLEAYAGVISTDFINELKISLWQQSIYFSPDLFMRTITDSELQLLKYFYPQLRDNICRPCKETPKIIQSLIQAFVYTIISIMDKGNQEAGTFKGTRNEQLFEKFMSLLSQYHSRERSVSFYADKMCLTSNYLSGEIKANSGKTASEWINEYVILEAKTLLMYSELSVQEISYRLNFPTQSSFGKYFKKQTGFGPMEFRKMM